MLRLYAVDTEDVPRLHVRNISLQLAKCEMATDYKQRANVIRIQACDRTILIECKDRIDMLTWLEYLQAATNIASSLEDRSMPKIHTLPRAPVHPTARRPTSNTNSSVSDRRQSTNGGSPQHHHQQQEQRLEFVQHEQHDDPQPRESLNQTLPSPPQARPRERGLSIDVAMFRPLHHERQMSSERTPQRQRQVSVSQPSSSSTSPQLNPTPYLQLQQALQSQQEQILLIQNRVRKQQRAQQLAAQSSMSGSVVNHASSVVAATTGTEQQADHYNHTASPPHSPPHSPSSHSNGQSSGRSSPQHYRQQQHQDYHDRQLRYAATTRVERESMMAEEDRQRQVLLCEEDAATRSMLHALGHSSESDSSRDSDDDDLDSVEDEHDDRHGTDMDVPEHSSPCSPRWHQNATLSASDGQGQQQHQGYDSQQETTSSEDAPAPLSPRSPHHRERYRQVEEQVRAYRGEDWEKAYTAYARQQELQMQQREQEQRLERRREERRQRASWNRQFFLGSLWGHHSQHVAEAQHGHGQPLALAAYT